MTYTYYADVRCLDNETLFREKVKLLSPTGSRKLQFCGMRRIRTEVLRQGSFWIMRWRRSGCRKEVWNMRSASGGKPALKYHPEICFSLSHSGDYAICTIGDKPVGNDIERERDGRLKVANRFFAKEELLWLYEAGEEEQTQRMFRLWTMKESL